MYNISHEKGRKYMKLEKAKKFVSAVITCTLTAGALSSCAPAVTTQNTSISPKNIEWLNEINDIPASEKDMQLQTPEETIEMPVQDSISF